MCPRDGRATSGTVPERPCSAYVRLLSTGGTATVSGGGTCRLRSGDETCECWRGRRPPLQARIGLRRAVLYATYGLSQPTAERRPSDGTAPSLPSAPPSAPPSAKGCLASQCRRRASRPAPKRRSTRWRPAEGGHGADVRAACVRTCRQQIAQGCSWWGRHLARELLAGVERDARPFTRVRRAVDVSMTGTVYTTRVYTI